MLDGDGDGYDGSDDGGVGDEGGCKGSSLVLKCVKMDPSTYITQVQGHRSTQPL